MSSSGPELELEPAERAPRSRPNGLHDYLGATYRRARRIGSGGMADVYEVEHVRLGSRFAAK